MNETCPECVRLWDEYLKARAEHTRAMKAFSVAEGSEAARLGAAAKLAYEAKECRRAEMTQHESSHHA